ncbi:MAG: adenylate/guanylate cyclase domain-containing protein [Proteobacteria bacterium]|nr:adenylate/guanylate cyclase domain-containing protein [Pseudomonadota bacterium]
MVRRLRLCSGLVLFTYVTTHLVNHSLGLISLDAMEDGRQWFLALWRNPVGTLALYGALTLHLSLVLWSIYQRRELRMPRWEAGQIALGLLIPPLLAEHIIGTRLLNAVYGVGDAYTYVVLVLWEFAPAKGVQQTLVLAIAWFHGCMGLHFWLRLKPWYPALVRYLYAVSILVPVLALLGFFKAGQEVSALARDPDWLNAVFTGLPFPDAEAVAFATDARAAALWVIGLLFVAVFAARLARTAWERRKGVFHLVYPGDRRVRATRGATILEVSRAAGIPHASVCGGRGRCSTCRVRIGYGLDALDAPSAEEQRVLKRVGAPPGVRLACQTRPVRDLQVTPLLPPNASPRDGFQRPEYLQGSELEIAVLFADLRSFTQLSEHKLPYDVVFLLNRYFRCMGEAVERAGGQVDKFIGDGVMALFGITSGPERGCREAMAGARAMAGQLDELNAALADDLDEPLRMGIGIHMGPAIVGEMGYASATSITAIGDAVNTASRLEAMTKEHHCQLILSEQVEERSGVDLSAFDSEQVEVRGRREPLTIRVIPDARALPVEPGPRPAAARAAADAAK